MICPKCGKYNSDSADFCCKCHNSLDGIKHFAEHKIRKPPGCGCLLVFLLLITSGLYLGYVKIPAFSNMVNSVVSNIMSSIKYSYEDTKQAPDNDLISKEKIKDTRKIGFVVEDEKLVQGTLIVSVEIDKQDDETLMEIARTIVEQRGDTYISISINYYKPYLFLPIHRIVWTGHDDQYLKEF